ncbi:MAG: DNA polymerase Y family protein [Granulosicoccus sp.]|nr:DNA polymerase Y family protein [Granulosicoccus sp.]
MVQTLQTDMLWLALHFPQLPIDRQWPDDQDQPRAVVLQEGPARRIMACNDCAATIGIHQGQALKNAYALAPNLITNDYDKDEQLTHLEQLGLSALQYSSRVISEAPDTIAIEIAASLTLFGGLNALHDRICEDMRAQRLSLHSAIAPTCSSAILFARAGIQQVITTKEALAYHLDNTLISKLPLDTFTFKGLRQSGLHTLGELRCIPPAALTRRFGKQCTQLLYKLDGRLPDVRTPLQAPETFSQAVDLPLEAPDTNALAFPLKRLFNALGGFSKARELGVVHLCIVLYHHRHTPVTVTLKFLDPTSDMTHLLRVATERLGQVKLQAPIVRLALTCTELVPLSHEDRDLFHTPPAKQESIEQLLDKLTARLGKQSIYTAMPGEDYRPEKAWAPALLDSVQSPAKWPARPTWLLHSPRRLDEPVKLHTPPERIENGWWDDLDVRRDYFIASNSQGSYFWVYRQRHQPDQWWVHGLFA